jgi:microcystin-dependent protein
MALEENQQQINLDTTFAGKVDFLQGVSFDNDVVLRKSISIDGDLVVNGSITASGSSGLTAENLKGGEQGSIPYQDSADSTTFLPPTNAAGRFLKSNGPGQNPEWVAIGGGQGALDLDSLQDVDNDVANATNNQIIKYNSTSGKWERSSDYVIQETSHADVVIDGDFTTQGLMKRGSTAGSYSVVTDNSNNWNTAFGWGNHATVGYIADSDFSSNGFMKRTGAGTYTVDGSTYISDITGQNLGDLANVSVASNPTFGHVLKWTGSAWTAQADGGGSGGGGAGVDGAPAGTVIMWSGAANSIPTGYLLCDGSAINRLTYTDLFNAIGTAHGSGDGSTTFNIPNLRNKFVVGEGTSYALAATGGSADATLVSHSHTVDSHTHSDGTLQADNHNHGSGNLTADNHRHAHGDLRIGDHSHTFSANLNTNTPLYVPSGDVDRGGGSSIFSVDNAVLPSVSGTTNGAGQINVGGDTSFTQPGVSGSTSDATANISGNTGGSSPGTDSQGSSATNANLPPYYSLCYIIKTTPGGAITATDSLTLTSTDDAAAPAPSVNLYRNSATPATNDYLGEIDFQGKNGTGVTKSYAQLRAQIDSTTAGSESGSLELLLSRSGSDVTINFPTSAGTLALISDVPEAFASGTRMLFHQTSAPTGWTKDTSNNNNSALRVVTGSAGSGGSMDFTSAFSNRSISVSGTASGNVNNGGGFSVGYTTNGRTLSESQLATHRHTIKTTDFDNPPGDHRSQGYPNNDSHQATRSTDRSRNRDINSNVCSQVGSSQSHDHSGQINVGDHQHSFSTGVNSSGNNDFRVKYVDIIIAQKN